jgi:CubicO group peptidase (beta-lactamase class C family)
MKMIYRSLITINGIVLLSTLFCAEQDALQVKVDDYVQGEIRTQQIPGLSVAVMDSGRIVLAKGYGFANVEHQVPVKPATIFQSGSMGKQFTATAVMMLVEDGKITLDDRISRYFTNAPGSWTNVTIRHLLTHTAGFTD